VSVMTTKQSPKAKPVDGAPPLATPCSLPELQAWIDRTVVVVPGMAHGVQIDVTGSDIVASVAD